MSQSQSDSDPLLAFSTERATLPPSPPPADQPGQPLAPPAVSATAHSGGDDADELTTLRARLHRLEQIVDQSAKEQRALSSEVATLVGVTADIKKRIKQDRAVTASTVASLPKRSTRVASAVAGVVLGVTIGVWFWTATGSEELLVPSAPVAIAGDALPIAPPPEPALESAPAPAATPAIVPAAAVTRVRDVAPREAPQRRDVYVGTLSIDSDPAGDVFIDRKAAGRTPLRAENLKAGSHLIWIEKDGFRRFTRVVQVPADRVTRLVADLEPAQR